MMIPTGQPSVAVAPYHGVNQYISLTSPNSQYGQQHRSRGVPSCLLCLSVTQIVIGVMSIFLGMTAVFIDCQFGIVGLGIWGGFAFFFVTGVLGCVAVMKVNKCLVIAVLVMSIISAVVAFTIFIMSVFAALDERVFGVYHRGEWQVAVDSSLAAAGIIEMGICIVTSSLCCYVLSKGTLTTYTPIMFVGQQVSPHIPMGEVQPVHQHQQPLPQQTVHAQPHPALAQPASAPRQFVTGNPQQTTFPQQIMMAPTGLLPMAGPAPPAQTAAPASVADTKPADAQALEASLTGENDHIHYDDTQGLIATA